MTMRPTFPLHQFLPGSNCGSVELPWAIDIPIRSFRTRECRSQHLLTTEPYPSGWAAPFGIKSESNETRLVLLLKAKVKRCGNHFECYQNTIWVSYIGGQFKMERGWVLVHGSSR